MRGKQLNTRTDYTEKGVKNAKHNGLNTKRTQNRDGHTRRSQLERGSKTSIRRASSGTTSNPQIQEKQYRYRRRSNRSGTPPQTKPLVIDANILFAALIVPGRTEELIISEKTTLYAPSHLFIELEKYADIILTKTHRSRTEYDQVLSYIKKHITIITPSKNHTVQARNISPDPDDTEYFAVALACKADLWSNDKKLQEQSLVKVWTTTELIALFDRNP